MDKIINPDNAYVFGSTTFNVRKMILRRTNKQGLTKVYIEVCKYVYEGEGKYATTIRRQSTGIWINPKNWSKKKAELTRNEEDYDFKNNKIDKTFTEIKNYINSKGQQEPDQAYCEAINLESLREFFPARKENRKCLRDYIEDYIKFRKKQNTPRNTAKEFTTMKNRLKKFDNYRSRLTYFEDLSFQWSDDFEFFLRHVAKHGDKKGYCEGTIEKTYTVLITVVNHFYERKDEMGIIIPDKFKMRRWKRGKKSINEANPLTPEQLVALYNYKFAEDYLEKTKTRFCLQCFTGLRYGDLHLITPETIKNNERIVLTPEKTKRFSIKSDIPLNDYSREILEQYDYDTTDLLIQNQPYNRNLKNLFEKMQEEFPDLKFNNDYRSHNGRDTFISNCVMAGVDWKTILGWVGQKSYKIMDRYIKITDEYQQRKMKHVFTKTQPDHDAGESVSKTV